MLEKGSEELRGASLPILLDGREGWGSSSARLPSGLIGVWYTLRKKGSVPHILPSDSCLLREDSQTEVSLLVRLKGAGDEDIVSRGQLEAARDFSQIDECLASGQRGMVPEKVPTQVFVLVWALQGKTGVVRKTGLCSSCSVG